MEGRAIKLRQLEYFSKALETGNITGAAEQLNVAQTALGIQIRNLEEELGVALLARHSRGVSTTDAGRVLDSYAREILALVAEAREALRKHAEGGAALVVMGITPSIMRLVGDDIVLEMSQTMPGVTLRVVEELSFVLMQLLERGEIDCALTFAPDPNPKLQRVALLEEELFFMVCPETSLERGPILFRDVLRRDLALTGREDAVARIVSSIAQRLGWGLNVTYEVQSIRAVKNLVAKGVAGAIMPYGAADAELKSGAIVARHIVNPAVVRTLMFVYPRTGAKVLETPAFRDFVQKVADRLHQREGPITRRL